MAAAGNDRDRAARAVRSTLHRLGYRFRLRREDLPGTPDIVLPRWRLAVLVVDCARYPHSGCPRAAGAGVAGAAAAANARLADACSALGRLGWETLVVQACEADDPTALGYRLDIALQGRQVVPATGAAGLTGHSVCANVRVPRSSATT